MNLSLLDPFALAQEYPESQSITLSEYQLFYFASCFI